MAFMWMGASPGVRSSCLRWVSLSRWPALESRGRNRGAALALSTGYWPTRSMALVRLSITFPWTTLVIAVLLAVGALWYTSTHLGFQTSRNALVSQKAPYIQRFEEIDRDFNDLSAFIVAVEPQRFERGKQFVGALAARLRADTQHFSQVVDKIDYLQSGREKTAPVVA